MARSLPMETVLRRAIVASFLMFWTRTGAASWTSRARSSSSSAAPSRCARRRMRRRRIRAWRGMWRTCCEASTTTRSSTSFCTPSTSATTTTKTLDDVKRSRETSRAGPTESARNLKLARAEVRVAIKGSAEERAEARTTVPCGATLPICSLMSRHEQTLLDARADGRAEGSPNAQRLWPGVRSDDEDALVRS